MKSAISNKISFFSLLYLIRAPAKKPLEFNERLISIRKYKYSDSLDFFVKFKSI